MEVTLDKLSTAPKATALKRAFIINIGDNTQAIKDKLLSRWSHTLGNIIIKTC